MAKSLGIVVLSLIVVIIVGSALGYSQRPQGMVKVGVESFVAGAQTARECQCLPGYIPSNKQKNKVVDTFFCQHLTDLTKTRPCY